jgi:dynein heavy chain
MRQFLLYNHVLTQEEIENYDLTESPPTLEQFKAQVYFLNILVFKERSLNRERILLFIRFKVDQYENTYETILKLSDICLIDKWFRIDNKPFKSALLNTIKKWSNMFKQYLMDDVVNRLNELDQFTKEKDREFIREVPVDDYDRLVVMMGHLKEVRDKTAQYDTMFDPIKDEIELLKSYDREISDDVYDKLAVHLF